MLNGYQRLQRLRTVMENVQAAKAHFDMHVFFVDADGEEDWCGSPSCAAGWATVDRVLQKEGLVRDMVRSTRQMSEFFGLNEKESDLIFMPTNYILKTKYRGGDGTGNITPAGVIARIDELLKTHAQRP